MRVHRGEVYFMNLDPVVGREQSGNHPVVVISADELNSLPLVAVVVIGTSGNKVAKDYLQMLEFQLGKVAYQRKPYLWDFKFELSILADSHRNWPTD